MVQEDGNREGIECGQALHQSQVVRQQGCAAGATTGLGEDLGAMMTWRKESGRCRTVMGEDLGAKTGVCAE